MSTLKQREKASAKQRVSMVAHVKNLSEAAYDIMPIRNNSREKAYFNLLRLVDTLLIIADVKMISDIEKFVDILLLTCHLVTSDDSGIRLVFSWPR